MINNGTHIKRLSCQGVYDVTPQAIFWRAIQYFAAFPLGYEDDFDAYLGVSFVIGNHVNFDLRHYDGHPEATVTVYLPSNVTDPDEIDDALNLVIDGLKVPNPAVAWRRGESFEYGELPRNPKDRLIEAEARVLALKIAAENGGRSATTDYIKRRVPELIPLTAKDLEQSPSRPREKKWQQIVGNVISHNKSRTGPFAQGLAERTTNGIKVTDAGINYLKSIGFLTES